MSFTHHSRLVNPRLGTFFGIFASALAGLVIMLLIFQQLGVSEGALRVVMLGGPLVLYAAIGIAAFTRDALEFFAAGRRVPAVYGGVSLAITAMGATGYVALTGMFFVVGYDALCIVLGGLSGFVVMAILLAPFFRKFGAFTIPSYLGRRFESRLLRVVSAGVLSVPLLLMLAAELRMGGMAAGWLLDKSTGPVVLMLGLASVAAIILGGMRSLTWVTVAQSITAILAIVVTIGIIGVLITNLPVPQLSHGPVVKAVGRLEQQLGMPTIYAASWTFEMPGEGFLALSKKFVDPFGSIGPSGFVVAVLTIMAGVASAPWLLPRVATAPGVYEARKSLGWATFFFGLVMLTLASGAVFMRELIMEMVAGPSAPIPEWLRTLVSLKLAEVDQSRAVLTPQSIALNRDTVLFSITVAHGLPTVLLHLVVTGAVAAALAAASAATVALGNIIAEDIVNGWAPEPAHGDLRLWLGRFAIGAAALVGLAIAILAPSDPLKLMLWSFALTGSAAFPVLILSIWWKRINAFGAVAGMAAGFGVALLAIIVGETHIINFDSPLAGVFGIPAAFIACIAASLATPAPSRHVLELVRDIRIPGGEILYDREMRLTRLKQRQRP